MPQPAVRQTPIDGEKLEDLVGLCLSGGGYRAMLFHAGAIFRMNELGLLAKLDEVSSVSGGSMTAAALAMAYAGFKYDATGVVTNLTDTFLKPILRQAADSIDVASGFAGLIPAHFLGLRHLGLAGALSVLLCLLVALLVLPALLQLLWPSQARDGQPDADPRR